MTKLTFYIMCILVLCTFFNFSSAQQNGDSSYFYNVNEWRLSLIEPHVYNGFETATTGMLINAAKENLADSIYLTWPGPVLGWFAGGQYCKSIDTNVSGLGIGYREEEPADSVLFIRIDAVSTQLATNWYAYYGYFRKYLSGNISPPTSCISISVKVNGYSNIYELGVGFGLYDFTNGIFSFRNGNPQLSPDWQRIEIPWGAGNMQNTEGIAIVIYGSTPLDSMQLFISLEFNDIVFHYENRDSLLIDPFQFAYPSLIVEELPGIPNGFVLHQNYPNPFNPSTRIRYEIAEPGDIKISVFSLLGEKVADVVDQYQTSGIYEAEFDASGLASGTYIYALKINSYTLRKKMLLTK